MMLSPHEYSVLYPTTTYVFFGLICLAIGSLLNVIIYRLPLMLHNEWSSECRSLLCLPEEPQKKLNLFYPRSFCPACHSMIPFWHNIPLLSFCLLKGRCKPCGQPISFYYPLIEVMSLVLSLCAAYHFGFHLPLMFALLFIWLLICLCLIDLQHQLLPDSLTLSLLWLGLIANTQTLYTTLPNAVLSAAGAYLGLWLFIKLFYFLTGKVGMGGGDFKLFAALGAWFGWTQLPFILLIAALTGALIGMMYLKLSKQSAETPIPFGPFLCFSGLTSLFYGPTLQQWYFNGLLS
jgi:leader peptidase (prepilin peptidase)/N-methyltransferase